MNGAVVDVALYGTRIAELRRGDTDHRPDWVWTPEAARRWGVGARIVGHKIAVGAPGTQLSPLLAGVFIDGLLPEGDARLHHAVNAGIDPDDTFALVRHYGRDTAGALEFVARTTEPPGHPSAPAAPAPLTDLEVRALLERAGSSRRDAGLTSTSLAGLVPKIALDRRADGTWLLPSPGHPSTWILKVAHPADSRAADVVDTEAACLDLGRRVRVTTVQAHVLDLDGLRAIAVSRYDRTRLAGDDSGTSTVGRIHQEDLAQATGINTSDPSRKFQRGRPIPSWRSAAEVLKAGAAPLSPLARLVTFSFLVGNTDHHAKNTSLLRHADGRVALAPAYDIAAHLHHPGPHRTALDLAGISDYAELTMDHVVAEIASWGVPPEAARDAARDVTVDLRRALHDIDRSLHPGVSAHLWELLAQRVVDAEAALRP